VSTSCEIPSTISAMLTVMSMMIRSITKSDFFWDMTPCSLVKYTDASAHSAISFSMFIMLATRFSFHGAAASNGPGPPHCPPQ
jgi:hypothetical protein